MSRSSTLILVGLLIIALSFIGVPLHWLRFFLPLLGLVVLVIGFLIRSDRVATLKREMPEPPLPSAHAPATPPDEISSIA